MNPAIEAWQSARHKTALHRKTMSKPVRILHEEGLLSVGSTFLDYGCGHGEDVRQLHKLGFEANGWDPAFRPRGPKTPSDVVNLGYVINVIESPSERTTTLEDAWTLANRVLAVSVRSTLDDGPDPGSAPVGDGFQTRLGSFQKFYDQHELRTWIHDSLQTEPFPAAPGIFLLFKDEALRETWRARRFHRRVVLPKLTTRARMFEEHKELLETVMAFFGERGRLPVDEEFGGTDAINLHFGSMARAFQVIRSVTGDSPWENLRVSRRADLLVWIALMRFQVRPIFTALPDFLQRDIKSLFSAYSKACQEADEFLMTLGKAEIREEAILQAPFGKRMPKGLYVHKDFIGDLPPMLRLFEGCARAFVGELPQANIIKFHRDGAQVSYLTYEDFDQSPHPELMDSVLVSLDGQKIRRRSYKDYANRFILHRKESFIPSTAPSWQKFHRLTLQEEKWGLFEDTATIGTRLGWEACLRAKHCRLGGHRLIRAPI